MNELFSLLGLLCHFYNHFVNEKEAGLGWSRWGRTMSSLWRTLRPAAAPWRSLPTAGGSTPCPSNWTPQARGRSVPVSQVDPVGPSQSQAFFSPQPSAWCVYSTLHILLSEICAWEMYSAHEGQDMIEPSLGYWCQSTLSTLRPCPQSTLHQLNAICKHKCTGLCLWYHRRLINHSLNNSHKECQESLVA